MKIEEHEKALEEHEKNIRRCIDEGLAENQRNIAYNASQAGIERLSIYLLKLKLVPVSINFDHRIFKNNAAVKNAFPFDFPEKAAILAAMKNIEEKRNILCYGKRKPAKECEEMLRLYNSLKELLGGKDEK